jgi:WD40 repeat protein
MDYACARKNCRPSSYEQYNKEVSGGRAVKTHISDHSSEKIRKVETLSISPACNRVGLKRAFHPARNFGHLHPPKALAISRNHKYIATGSDCINLWDATTGEHLRTVYGHKKLVGAIMFYDDLIVASSSDGNLNFWSTRSGSLIYTAQSVFHPMLRVSGALPFVLCSDQTTLYCTWTWGSARDPWRTHIEAWDPRIKKCLRIVEHGFERFEPFSATRGDGLLVGIANEHGIGWVDSASGAIRKVTQLISEESIPQPKAVQNFIYNAVTSPDQLLAYAYAIYGNLYKLDLVTGEVLATKKIQLQTLEISPNGEELTDGTVVLDAETLRVKRTLFPPKQPVPRVAAVKYFPGGRKLILSTAKGLTLIDATSGERLWFQEGISSHSCTRILESGRAVTSSNGELLLWKLKDGVVLRRKRTPVRITSELWAPFKGDYFVSRDVTLNTPKILLWNARDLSLKVRLSGLALDSLDSQGKFAGGRSDDRGVCVLDLNTLSIAEEIKISPSDPESTAISPIGTVIAVACKDSKIRVYDFAKRRIVLVIESGPAKNLQYSPDGTLLAGRKLDPRSSFRETWRETFVVWNSCNGEVANERVIEGDRVDCAAISDNNDYLALGLSGRKLEILSLPFGELLFELFIPTQAERIYYPEGEGRLLVVLRGGDVYEWNLRKVKRKIKLSTRRSH